MTVCSTASPHLVFQVSARAAGRVRDCQLRSVVTCCASRHGQVLLDLWGSPCSFLKRPLSTPPARTVPFPATLRLPLLAMRLLRGL